MTELEALVSLNMCQDIGSARLRMLLAHFGKPENILKARREELVRIAGIGDKTAAGILSQCSGRVDKEFELARRLGLKIISWNSPDYPKSLTYISDPPVILYVKGEIRQEDILGVAVVGSRRASFYGIASARKIAGELCEKGFTVISGLARGIDTAAHKGALACKGRTLAVIGSGFNHLYPPENKELAGQIAGCGAVISEFPITAAPTRLSFPRRNRIISGLSLGVLVVEAAQNSGALITADFALEQGREVFALPGNIDLPTAAGTNDLIKQGAKLVTSAEDIIAEFQPAARRQETVRIPSKEIQDRCFSQELTPQETAVFSFISAEAIHVDEITQRSALDISKIYSILLGLRRKKLIQELPGKQFMRIQHV